MLSWRILQVVDLVSVSTLPLVAGPLFSRCVYIALRDECRSRGGGWLGKWQWSSVKPIALDNESTRDQISYPPEDILEPLLFNGSHLLALDAHECIEPYF